MLLIEKLLAINPTVSEALKYLFMSGLNSSGGLGDNSITNRSSPVQTIAGGTNWSQVSCGYSITFSRNNTAAIKTDGTLWTWGFNGYGQLGTNDRVHRSSPVQTVSGGTNWKQVSAGGETTAAIKTDGTLWLWGFSNQGQLGDNTIANKSSPVQTVSGGTNWKQVSCGTAHNAAIKTDGTLWLWGFNGSGRLGDNTITNKSSPVQTVSGGTNWSQVSAGDLYTAAIKTDGTLWTWGDNSSGQLGDNSRTSRSSPVQTVSGGTNWKQVSAGSGGGSPYCIAAIKTDGTLWTWGFNGFGQLGDNSRTSRSSPVQTVAGGTNWNSIEIAAAAAAIKTDGTLWTWGLNGNGQLGDNTIANKSSPVQTVSGGTNWKQVSTSGAHTGFIND